MEPMKVWLLGWKASVTKHKLDYSTLMHVKLTMDPVYIAVTGITDKVAPTCMNITPCFVLRMLVA